MVAAPPFAAPSDVAALWRALSDDETVKAATLLDEASQVILEVFGVPSRIASGLLMDGTLRSVCARMVVRVMLNPQRLSQFAVSVEDVSRSGTYESGAVPIGELMITPNELDRLWGLVGLPGAFSALQPWLAVPPVQDPNIPWGFVDQLDSSIYLLDPSA